jgi:hypothetical protein
MFPEIEIMMYWKGLTAVAAAAAVLTPAVPVSADVEIVGATKDNTLYQTTDGSLSNGLGEHFFAGRTDQSDEDSRRRGVVAFDLSTIPSGSTINSATLTLRMSRTQAGSENVTVHRVLSDWGEGTSIAGGNEGPGASSTPSDATWLHTFYNTLLWSSTGGDFQATASSNANVGGNGFYDWSSGAMAADVQHWLDNPSQNYGWIVIGNESATKTAKRFDSLQNGNASRRPQLTIDFTPPANTGACCFGDGNCQILSSADCTTQGGAYEGDGTTCSPNPCPQPEGACCFLDESCLVLTQDDCSTPVSDHHRRVLLQRRPVPGAEPRRLRDPGRLLPGRQHLVHPQPVPAQPRAVQGPPADPGRALTRRPRAAGLLPGRYDRVPAAAAP